MVSVKFFALKTFIVLLFMVIVTMILISPQSSTLPRRNVMTSHPVPYNNRELQRLQPSEQPDRVDSVYNLVPNLPKNTTLLIIINTIPREVKRREILRQTWAKQSYWTFPTNVNRSNSRSHSGNVITISYFFMMAFDGNSTIDEGVNRESTVHRDILRVNLTETYRGLINKVLLSYEWVTKLDLKPLFIAKADHDVYVKSAELASWLEKYSRSPSKIYAGFVERNAAVRREVGNPWYVSKEDYDKVFYPTYCRGPFYVLSRDLFLDVVNASKVNKPFPVEDAYIALLVEKLGVKPLNTGRDLFNTNRGLENHLRKIPEDKVTISSGAVLGDSLSSASINLIHRVYMKSKIIKAT